MKKPINENHFIIALIILLFVNIALLRIHISMSTYTIIEATENDPLPRKSNADESLDMMDEFFTEGHERAETVLEHYSSMSPAFSSEMILEQIEHDGYYFKLIGYPEDFGNMVYVDNKTIIESKMKGLKVGSVVTGVFSDMETWELESIQPELPSAQTIHHQY